MRITHDLISNCPTYTSPTYERTLDMHGYKSAEIDNLSATLVSLPGLLRLHWFEWKLHNNSEKLRFAEKVNLSVFVL